MSQPPQKPQGQSNNSHEHAGPHGPTRRVPHEHEGDHDHAAHEHAPHDHEAHAHAGDRDHEHEHAPHDHEHADEHGDGRTGGVHAHPNRPGGRGDEGHADHAHGHGDGHDHGHEHGHDEGWFASLFSTHSHDHGELASDSVLATSDKGIRALKLSLVGLGLTAAFQVFIVVISGSVGLLADTIHNFGDALTAIPLWIAFSLDRRTNVPKGYTYRYGRAEDLAGVFIVLVIAFSAAVVFWESWQKFAYAEPLQNLGWVALASIIGFVGNEAVAWLRISTGREIGSAALVADGVHARTDGLTSLAVLVGVIGVWLGFPLADPLVGMAIGVAILFILRDSARTMWRRLMDAVEPELLDRVEAGAAAVPGVLAVDDIRMRWIGHALWCELRIEVDGQLSTIESHKIAEEVRHDLFHALPRLREITVHVDPASNAEAAADMHHELTAHHRPERS